MNLLISRESENGNSLHCRNSMHHKFSIFKQLKWLFTAIPRHCLRRYGNFMLPLEFFEVFQVRANGDLSTIIVIFIAPLKEIKSGEIHNRFLAKYQ